MAIKLPVYNQQTSTPGNRMQGGDPRTAGVDYSAAEGLSQLAQGVGVAIRQRKDAEDSAAAADASKKLADAQLAAVERSIEIRRTAGPGGVGVLDAITAEMNTKRDEVLATITNETARKYFTQQWTGFDLNQRIGAVEYEAVERERQALVNFDGSIKSAAAISARAPEMAAAQYAQVVAPIKADRNISEQARAARIEAAGEEISYAAASSAVENDPYEALRSLNIRFGLSADATAEQAQLHMDGGVKLLEAFEASTGITVPAAQREEAIAAWAAGGGMNVLPDGKLQITRGDQSGVPTEAGFAFDMLSVPRALELRARAQAKIAQLESDARQLDQLGRVTFDNALSNTVAAFNAGEPAPMPSYDDLVRYHGPERAAIEYQELQIKRSMAGELTAMAGMTNEEMAASLVPPTGTENRAARDVAYEIKRQRAVQIINERKDPGQFVLDHASPVSEAFKVYQDKMENGDAAEQQAAMTAYITASNSAQIELGLTPMLPNGLLDTFANQFAEGMKTDNPEAAARTLESVALQMRNSPDAVRALAAKVDTLGQFAIDGVPGKVIARVRAGLAVEEADLKKLLPTNVTWKDVSDAVDAEFAPLISTFAAQTDNPTAKRYLNAGRVLAAELVQKGADPQTAARKAYADLFAGQNAVVGTYRVPNTYDPKLVGAGLDGYLSRFDPMNIDATVEAGISEQETAYRAWRTIRMQSQWVNDQIGEGVFLMRAGKYVNDADGKPIYVPFSKAMLEPPPDRTMQNEEMDTRRLRFERGR